MSKIQNRVPYRLPKPLYCDPEEIGERPSMEQVKEYIRLHETRLRRYEYLESLYEGFHDIFRQPDKADWKPDWRLAVNFPRYITDTFAGYGYGTPVKISHPDEAVSNAVEQFERNNEFSDVTMELVRYCSMYGHAWSYLYQDEQAQTNVTALTPKEFFCVYDDTMKKRAVFAVRYGRHEVGDYKGELYGEIITPKLVQFFDRGRIIPEREQANEYGRINAVEWQLNSIRMGLYEPVAGLIELFNHTLSEKGNDVDAFAEAILAVIGAEVDEKDIEDMRDKRLVNLFGTENVKDALVQYLTKPSADGTQENLLNRLERLIYQIAMVANISDDSFGSAVSGVALAYKLWSTSNVVQTFNRKIEKSLRKMFKLWCSFGTNCSRADAYEDMDFQFSVNIPRNLQEETDTAVKADGLISKRTQLSLLSYVPDPDAEMEQIEKERQEDEARHAQSLYGGDVQAAVAILEAAGYTVSRKEVIEDGEEDTAEE